jgi:hypothetical protein
METLRDKNHSSLFEQEILKYDKDTISLLAKEGDRVLGEMNKNLFLPLEENKMEILNPVMVRPNELNPGDKLGFKVIAVIGYGGDWAAYYGLTCWTDEEVAEGGDKLNKDAAEKMFYAPVAAGLKYRL